MQVRPLVGFVGLGNMGTPLACNLLGAGFDVLGFDIQPSPAFENAGGRAAATVAQVAGARTIVQSLPHAQAFEATMQQLLPQCEPGHVIIDLSSYPLAVKQQWAQRAAQQGVTLLDCEVSGLPFQAAERRAVIFKSGNQEAIHQADAVFSAMAQQHFYLGEFGAATQLKLIANTMVCVNNLMAAEAINLGRLAGIDPELLVKVLGPSAAGSTTFTNKAPLMLTRGFNAGKGPFRHMFGYLGRAEELAAGLGASTPLLDATRAVYGEAEKQNRHDQDIAAILEVIEAGNR